MEQALRTTAGGFCSSGPFSCFLMSESKSRHHLNSCAAPSPAHSSPQDTQAPIAQFLIHIYSIWTARLGSITTYHIDSVSKASSAERSVAETRNLGLEWPPGCSHLFPVYSVGASLVSVVSGEYPERSRGPSRLAPYREAPAVVLAVSSLSMIITDTDAKAALKASVAAEQLQASSSAQAAPPAYAPPPDGVDLPKPSLTNKIAFKRFFKAFIMAYVQSYQYAVTPLTFYIDQSPGYFSPHLFVPFWGSPAKRAHGTSPAPGENPQYPVV